MSIDNKNGVNESVENKKKNSFKNKNKFLKDFCEKKIKDDSTDDFLNNVMNASDIDSDLKKEFEKFIKYSPEEAMIHGENIKKEYSGVDLSSLNIKDFKKQLLPNIVKLNKYRDALKNELISEYNIDNDYINKNLLKQIEKLSETDIFKLIGQNKIKNRRKFLKKILGNKNLPKTKDLVKGLDKIFSKIKILDRSDSILFDLSEKEKLDLQLIIVRINDKNYSPEDIQTLFNYGFFNTNEIEQVVKVFLPNISLKEALDNKIVDNDFAEGYKKDLIESYNRLYKFDNTYNIVLKNEDIILFINRDLNSLFELEKIGKNIYFNKINTSKTKVKSDESKNTYNTKANTDKDSQESNNETNNTSEEIINNFIEQEKKANTPETKSEFLNFGEKLNKKITNDHKFDAGNYLVINIVTEEKDGDKTVEKNLPVFYKIVSVYEDELSIIHAGIGNVDLLATKPKRIKKDLLKNYLIDGFDIEGNGVPLDVSSISFETKKEIKAKIDNETYIDFNKSYTESEYERLLEIDENRDELNKIYLENKRKKYLSGEYDSYSNEINDLLEQIERKSKNLELLEKNIRGELDLEILDLKNKIKDIDLKIDKEIFKEFVSKEESKTILEKIEELGTYTIETLLKELDDEDDTGSKLGLEKGVSFSSKKGIFSIINNPREDGFVNLKGISGEEKEITFEQFLSGFKELEGKRLTKSLSFEETFESLKNDSNIGNNWSKYDFNNGEIKKKETKEDIEYSFLTSTENDDLIQIHSISGDMVHVTFGEYDSYERDSSGNTKKDKDGKKIEKKSFSLYEGTEMNVTVSWIEAWIKENKAEPRSLDEDKDIKKEDVDTVDLGGGFMTRLFNRTSFGELLAGGKFFIESIENYMKEGNEEHAARFASGVLGKVLPDELQNDLMSRTEESQKKRADDYINKLKNVDSWKATEMIGKRLQNKDTPQYKKEAGILFMLEKYGVLYAKKGLHPYKGKFLWYESMGGKVGDELYNKVKVDAEKLDENFREEELIYQLMKKQCGDSGFNGIKRRSRLHKEVKRLRAQGKQGEYDTGKGDAVDERTVEKRVGGAIGELEGGTYPNAVGWLEEAVNKGGSMEILNKVPFVIAFSGIGYKFEQNTLDQLKNFPVEGRMLPLLRFLSLQSDMDLANDTILEVSKRLSEIKGKPEIYSRAKKIFDNQGSTSIDDRTKISETVSFYDDYGDLITRSLYMLNDGRTDTDAWLSKIIRLEKDSYVDGKGKTKEGNGIFKRYYEKLNDYKGDLNFNNDDLQSDAFAGAGTGGLNMHKASKVLLENVQGGTFRMSKSGQIFLDEVKTEIEAIQQRKYGNDDVNDKMKRSDMFHLISGVISGILAAHGGNPTALNSMINTNTSAFASMIHSKGLDFNGILKYSAAAVIDGKADDLINGYVNILLSGKNAPSHDSHSYINPTGEVIDETKKVAESTLYDRLDEMNGTSRNIED